MKRIPRLKILSYSLAAAVVLGALLTSRGRLPLPPGLSFDRPATAQSNGWVRQTSGTTDTLWSVHFVSDTVGWVAGDNATLLRTTDGGVTWSPVSNCLTPPDGFFSVRLLNQSLIWAGGDLSVVRSDDGGSNFACGSLDANAFHNTFFPTSTGLVWSAGLYSQPSEPFDSCQLLSRISFNGSSFTEEVFTQCPGVALNDLYFVNSGTGWAVGESGRIVRITNAAATPPTITAQTSGTTELLWGVYMLDLNTGWVVGDTGTILKTTNGGTNWTPQASETTTDLRDVHFVDANKGWVVGVNGSILFTANGGASWTQETSGATDELENVFFPSAGFGYAVGQNGTILKRTGSCDLITVSPNTPTLPTGTAGTVYSQTFTQTGGAGSIAWSVSAGALPGGLTLNAGSGVLAGTPTAAGNFTFTIRATDANQCVGARQYSLTINAPCPAITVNPSNPTLPTGTAGQGYSQTFTATGGAPSYTFTVIAGALPAGLALSSPGILSGTPTAFGPFSFTVRAMDANACTGERQYSLTINPPCGAITVNPATLPDGTVATAYNQSVTATGGTAPYSFSVSGGALPPGVSLSSGGALTGTPTSSGTFNFTIQAADAKNCTGSRGYSVVINGISSGGLLFYPLAHPVRLLDTRAGAAGCYTPGAAIPGGTSRTQPARGVCDGLTIPATAAAITGNITTVQSGGGYLTLYPSDAAQPTVANSNYGPNEILNNVFTVGLGNADGAFKIFVTSNTHVVVDVTGYYAPPDVANPGGLYFHPLPKPIRLLDTRAGATGCTTPNAPLLGNADTTQAARLTCDGVTIPATALAITGNATTVSPQGPGFPYLTLFPADATRPLVASSNYLPGQVMNAPFTVGLSAAGQFKIYPTTQTELVIDVLGYYSADATDANGAGLLFYALPHPVRMLDTRPGAAGCYTPNAPLLVGSTRTQPSRGLCDGVTIAATALGIVGNATVVNTAGGYLTFWPSSAAQPLVATSNFTAGQVFNRHFTVGLGAGDGAFKIFTQFQTDLVVDVSGYFAP